MLGISARPDSHGAHGSRPHHHGGAFDSERLAASLEVEGELSSGPVVEAIATCADLLHRAGVPVRRVIDLGCGPGVGTSLLAEAFGSATVLAVDGSSAMLKRAKARAGRLGHAARVGTRRLDLDGDLRSLGSCDLAWAAMAIHHADDEVATLRHIRSLLAPRGLVCVLERADPMLIRFVGDLGRPGIWDRLESARLKWFESVRATMPGALNAEAYPSILAAAGLELLVDGTLSGTVEAPQDAATHRFIAGQLERTVRDLTPVAAEHDLEALRELVDSTAPFPEGRWEGARVTSSRKLLVARATG
jgi:SAM-dependent methyltransferase